MFESYLIFVTESADQDFFWEYMVPISTTTTRCSATHGFEQVYLDEKARMGHS